jgi:hypothetical protein
VHRLSIILTIFYRADDLEVRVEELSHRLENQTTEVLRLTVELEEYEYKDFGTANNSGHHDQDGEGESEYEYVDEGDENGVGGGKQPW